jgi:hypothetical protein
MTSRKSGRSWSSASAMPIVPSPSDLAFDTSLSPATSMSTRRAMAKPSCSI